MKTKLLLFFFCLSVLGSMGQGTITRNKCKTCGQVVSQCPYKGRHPKPQQEKPKQETKKEKNKKQTEKKCKECGKVISQCEYNGKHPKPEKKCEECGKPLSQCTYNGKHPQPEEAGYDVTFTCNVPTANLSIDGIASGTASGKRFLKTGQHSINITSEAHEDYTQNIIVDRQHCTFDFTLKESKLHTSLSDSLMKDSIIDYEYVDLGLSVKWSTKNIGASTTSDYGHGYSWGEIKHFPDTSNVHLIYEKSVKDISGNPNFDAVRANLGSPWRMPTLTEWKELLKKCKWEWTTQDGKQGYKVTSKVNGASIFIPAIKNIQSTKHWLDYVASYWSSTPNNDNRFSTALIINIKLKKLWKVHRRAPALIRPVCE